VEVYPVGNSLKDYEIQLLVNGKYVTVATVKNASGRPQTCTFKPQQCDAVRLVATAGNEAYTRIYEIKVFAK
jgi:archaellum component FlaG (FlaF/FlaG flagellin family)